jgi:hypothetical protein
MSAAEALKVLEADPKSPDNWYFICMIQASVIRELRQTIAAREAVIDSLTPPRRCRGPRRHH